MDYLKCLVSRKILEPLEFPGAGRPRGARKGLNAWSVKSAGVMLTVPYPVSAGQENGLRGIKEAEWAYELRWIAGRKYL